ncbi:Nn.00g033950.m01.CDS01 [Neocucurbitaria sp. VM-36]
MSSVPQSTCSPDGNLYDRPLSLESLPSELIQLIVAYLSTSTLKSVALVSRCLNGYASDILWQSVCLTDQWNLHLNEQTDQLWGERGHGEPDEHDDTPIVQKLYILATYGLSNLVEKPADIYRNSEIASKVHVLTHRCHLPTPNIFTELPRMYFHAETLSQDGRLHVLLKLAIRNMVNVHTLRVVYGHWKLTSALVLGFLDQNRSRRVPLRKLWLESCCFTIDSIHFLLPSHTTGLESVRIRRLRSESLNTIQARGMGFLEFHLSRSGQYYQMHNGSGGWVGTTVHFSEEGLPERWPRQSLTELMAKAKAFDAVMWDELPEIKTFVDANEAEVRDTRALTSPVEPLQWLLNCSAATLTSLNLDWILWRRKDGDPYDNSHATLNCLRTLRFPHLRAFQVRNAVIPHTKLPDGIFLLEDTFLEFLECHLKIQCLGWPLDKFYSHVKPSLDVQNRSRKLVAHLAMMLTDLRIDTQYTEDGEPLTDEISTTHGIRPSQTIEKTQERDRRRRFIAEFAPHLRKVEQIKLEGGIPRDEKRELLRALHWCPLKKIVMIGLSFPAGNTWGAQGLQLKALDPGQNSDSNSNLEEEDLAGILASYRRGFSISQDFKFEPEYGWPAQAPLLQTIALHHASTVEELKICGYNGCPILSFQTPMTSPLLAGLRHYDNLNQLVISLWLLTWFEDSYRDTEIIQSWLDIRSPASTALAVVTPPTSPTREHPVDPGQFPTFNARVAPRQEFNRWAVALKTRYSPSALAYRVARDLGPYLSPVAKERPGGVKIRASFCLGAREEGRSASDIFDLEIRVGRDDQVLEYIGPREEGEKGRWWSKLEGRRWF